ncbi:MAG: hypothetical protein E7496_10725 [Ruminococcus sp.]|nr:hypothetical protein [Ruminococcus sp.]
MRSTVLTENPPMRSQWSMDLWVQRKSGWHLCTVRTARHRTCPSIRKVTEEKYLNSNSVCKGLEKLRKEYPDEFIYVILDNAAYQKCKKVKHCAESFNINLVFLPPYSPNLNLIERLWKFLRKKIMANKYYCTFSVLFLECFDSTLSG